MKASIEQQSDGTYIAYNTTGDSVQLIGTGATIEETKDDFFNSIKEIKETYKDLGDKAPAWLWEDVKFHIG